MQDNQGRPYLKLSEIDAKTVIAVGAGFTCMRPGMRQAVMKDDKGYYIFCRFGKHYLNEQAYVDDEHCVGIYKVEA